MYNSKKTGEIYLTKEENNEKKKEEKKQSVMESGLSFIRRFDYFGRPINLNIKGEE